MNKQERHSLRINQGKEGLSENAVLVLSCYTTSNTNDKSAEDVKIEGARRWKRGVLQIRSQTYGTAAIIQRVLSSLPFFTAATTGLACRARGRGRASSNCGGSGSSRCGPRTATPLLLNAN